MGLAEGLENDARSTGAIDAHAFGSRPQQSVVTVPELDEDEDEEDDEALDDEDDDALDDDDVLEDVVIAVLLVDDVVTLFVPPLPPFSGVSSMNVGVFEHATVIASDAVQNANTTWPRMRSNISRLREMLAFRVRRWHESRTLPSPVSQPGSSRASRRHTVVISDVHLSQAHPDDPSDPLWMRYRRAEYHPDEELATLVDHLLATRGHDEIELCFNGDVFDFDAPWVKDGESSFDEFPLDEAGCAEHARRIVRDHDVWFRATARLLLAGHRLLLLSGNHDVELHWPGVRRAIREEIARLAEIEQTGAPFDRTALMERVRFRAWFHVTEDGIYLEHGSQYDIFSAVRYPMLPVTRSRDWIHPQMGKLAFKRTGSRMGYFNPYYEETFYMGLVGYVQHFFRFYARSHRHIWRTWLFGGVRTAAEIWKHRHREDWTRENRALACEETGASAEAVDRTYALAATPAEHTMLPILRELWLDRLALLLIVISATAIGGAAFGLTGAGVALGLAATLIVVYELMTPKPDLRTYDSAPPGVKDLFEIHGARAVCMGHTHRPFGHFQPDGSFWGNSGSWCPAFRDQLCTEPVLAKRPLLMLTTDGAALSGGLFWWDGRDLVAEPHEAHASRGQSNARLGEVPAGDAM